MRPDVQYVVFDGDGSSKFGEINDDNELYGRGILIWSSGDIHIGYFENSRHSTGHYIIIFSDFKFDVGEIFWKDGHERARGTEYNTDGTEVKYAY